MPITEAMLNSFRNAGARAIQDINEAFRELQGLYDGIIVKSGTEFQLELTQDQKDALKTRLTIVATELKLVGDKILQAIA